MANIPGSARRAKLQEGRGVEPAVAQANPVEVLNQLLASLQDIQNVLGPLAQRVARLEEGQLPVQQGPRIDPIPQPHEAPTRQVASFAEYQSERINAKQVVDSEKVAFWNRLKTQPKRRVVVMSDWETEIFGVSIFYRKGLREMPEEIAQAYEDFVMRMQVVEGFNDQWRMIANQNQRDPGTMHYPDVDALLRGI
jgi:hypothetical protein